MSRSSAEEQRSTISSRGWPSARQIASSSGPSSGKMSFLALEFDANAADAERWADALLDAGALAVDTADPYVGSDREIARYGEPNLAIAPTADDLWPVCRLSALFGKDVDAGDALTRVSAALGTAVPAHTIAAIADDDWVRKTQQQFQPICAAPGLWIVPSWCEPVDPKAINLRLDPGLAFGTGSHPTTRMCLRWLALHYPAERGHRLDRSDSSRSKDFDLFWHQLIVR